MKRVLVWLLMSMYSVFGFCQMHYTAIGIEPLKMMGSDKRAGYPAVKAMDNGRVQLWKLYKDLESQNSDTTTLGKEFSIRLDGDSLRFPAPTVLNHAILTPVPSEEDKYHTIWANDSLFFNIPEEQDFPDGRSLMLWSPGQLGKGKKFLHLTGMLQIPLNAAETTNLGKIEVIADESHAITGMFSVDLTSPTLKQTEIVPAYSISIKFDGSASSVYLPVAPGLFKSLSVTLVDKAGHDINSYRYSDIIVERGHVTTLSDSNQGVGSYSCTRTRIKSFCVDKICSDWPEVEETKDPSPVSAVVVFDENAKRLFRVNMTGFHWLHVPYQPLVRHYIKTRKDLNNEMDVYGNIAVTFDSVEIFPGHNSFKVGAIAFRECSSPKVEMSQYVSSKRRVINLFLKTYTCCFDYRRFARNDTLCSYIPDWNAKKWTAPVITGEWKFTPNVGDVIKERIYPYQIRDRVRYPSDNHWKIPLSNFWDRMLINKEGYHIVKSGIVEYQLSSRYVLPEKIHKEKTGEPKRFTTDIVTVGKNYSRQADGRVVITGLFREQYIKDLCDDIKFSSDYFNGCERGVILIDEEKYQGKDGLPHDIGRHKHISATKSGASWRTRVAVERGKTYLVWTYLIVNSRMFLSQSAILKEDELDGSGFGIFEEWPRKYKPYESELLELSKNYISAYRMVNGTTGYVSTMKAKHEAEDKLLKRSKEIFHQFGLKNGDVDSKIKTIRYTKEGDLPYDIVTPINKAGIVLPYDMFAPDENKPEQGKVVSANMFPVRKGSILKQHPLVFVAYVNFGIKIKRIESSILQIHAYIPGNGPDGKRMGYVYTMSHVSKQGSIGPILLEGSNVGDIVQVGAFIYGWGTPEMLDQMKTITFTANDYDKDRRGITVNTIAKFPRNPLIDWMDDWYENLK